MLLDLHIGFSRGRSGGLICPSLSEFSTVYCDPHSQLISELISWESENSVRSHRTLPALHGHRNFFFKQFESVLCIIYNMKYCLKWWLLHLWKNDVFSLQNYTKIGCLSIYQQQNIWKRNEKNLISKSIKNNKIVNNTFNQRGERSVHWKL